MYGRLVPQAESVPVKELGYEVTFALGGPAIPIGERAFLVKALHVAEDDTAGRIYEFQQYATNAVTENSEADSAHQEAGYLQTIEKGYAGLAWRLENRPNSIHTKTPDEEVPFTFSEIVLSVEALRIRADAPPFAVKRSLWRLPGLEVADLPTAERALRMANKLLSLCDSRHLENVHAYFDPTHLTPTSAV